MGLEASPIWRLVRTFLFFFSCPVNTTSLECFDGLGPYSAPQSDVWSLGVVLVNLVCARNPWRKATKECPIFNNFFNNPNYLLEILPISCELNDILKRIFYIDRPTRISLQDHAPISLQELRVKVRSIKRFRLTKEELQRAGSDVKNIVKSTVKVQKSAMLAPGAPHAVVPRRSRT